ncbi:MAG: chemotaxis protein CheW, partial [Halarsenatibacteraceae bacterium]
MEAVTVEEQETAVKDNYLDDGMHDSAGNRDQFVVFQLGSEEYGVNISQAKEIIKPKNITNVPNTPEHVLGVINLRGQIVPVVDMKKRFSIELDSSEEIDSSRIITVEVNDALIGIKVDGVNEVVWLDQDKLEPAPEV